MQYKEMKSLKQGVSEEWLLKGDTNDEQALVQCTVRVPTAGLQQDPAAGVVLVAECCRACATPGFHP